MRIFGLASGIPNVEEMIENMMKAERTKVNRVEQDKQILTWKQEIYDSLNKDIANFILNSQKELGFTGTNGKNLDWGKKAIVSNDKYASVKVGSGTAKGVYEVGVDRLADGVKLSSKEGITTGTGKSNLSEQFGMDPSETMTFSIETKKGTVKVAIGSDANASGADIVINESLDKVSLRDLVDHINKSDKGVQATYDENIDRFFLQTTDTGKDAFINIKDSNASGESFLNALKLNVTSYDDTGVSKTESFIVGNKYQGVNAKISFNGAENIEMSSNQFKINGIDFDIKDIGKFTVRVEDDVDGIYDKLSKFVEDYNKIVDSINKLVSDIPPRGDKKLKPLTKEEKEAMKEDEVKLWEQKAKQGILFSDNTLKSVTSRVRTGLYEKVEGLSGMFDHLTAIGITTEGMINNKGLGGKLVIDKDKLSEAIAKDANGVMELLFKETPKEFRNKNESELTREELKQKRSQSGIINRMFDNLIAGMTDIVAKSGLGDNEDLYRKVSMNITYDFRAKYKSRSFLGEDISKLDKRIDSLNLYLQKVEESHYRKFSALESAMQKMNAQGAWLMQQFGGGN